MEQKIKAVEAMEGPPETICITMESGSTLLLVLEPKFSDPLFAEIPTLALPRTDGNRVYWSNGASLSVAQIMEMLTEDAPPKKKEEIER